MANCFKPKTVANIDDFTILVRCGAVQSAIEIAPCRSPILLTAVFRLTRSGWFFRRHLAIPAGFRESKTRPAPGYGRGRLFSTMGQRGNRRSAALERPKSFAGPLLSDLLEHAPIDIDREKFLDRVQGRSAGWSHWIKHAQTPPAASALEPMCACPMGNYASLRLARANLGTGSSCNRFFQSLRCGEQTEKQEAGCRAPSGFLDTLLAACPRARGSQNQGLHNKALEGAQNGVRSTPEMSQDGGVSAAPSTLRWPAAQLRSCADIPPSAHNDQTHATRRKTPA